MKCLLLAENQIGIKKWAEKINEPNITYLG